MNNKGFSLIEISIVVLVISVIASSSLSILGKKNNADDTKNSREKVEYVARAIQVYFNQRGYLPCPARFNAAADDPEETEYPVGKALAAGCKPTPSVSGIMYSSTNDEADIVGGTVPYIDLGIEPDSMIDEWGRRLTYLVDVQMATNSETFTAELAHIEVKGPIDDAIKRKPRTSEIGQQVIDCTDASGGTRINATDYSVEIPVCVAYALISHGPNGQWGIKGNGQAYVNNETNYGPYEISNSLLSNVAGGTFNDSIVKVPLNEIYQNNPVGSGYFDDIVVYREKEYLENERANSQGSSD